MPIKIFKDIDRNLEVAWLCDDDWELPRQIGVLSEWLRANNATLTDGPYTADVGFSIRPEAFGGGAVLDPDFLGLMSHVRMSLFLSEYPNDWNEWMARPRDPK